MRMYRDEDSASCQQRKKERKKEERKEAGTIFPEKKGTACTHTYA